MEHYYFIQKDGAKQGPLKLAELKLQTIYFDELIWRSDNDQWKKASEFEELQDVFIIKPPLTPIEGKRKEFNNHFITTILPFTLVIYVVLSLIISVSSFSIADKSWKDERNKYIINKEIIGDSNLLEAKQKLKTDIEKLQELRPQIRRLIQDGYPKKDQEKTDAEWRLENKYYELNMKIFDLGMDSSYYEHIISHGKGKFEPIFRVPENVISLENIYGLQQPFLFRTYYAFFSKIYLTREEQTDSGKLFLNIALSSFLSLLMLVIVILIAYYFIKVQMVRED